MSVNLPTPLAAYFDAKNAHDIDGMLAAFAEDAKVRDEGHEMIGRAAIRNWMDETTRKYRVTVKPLGVKRENQNEVVTAQVSGTFPGSPVELNYRFTIANAKIVGLAIK